jgi:hypothetical protein
MKTKIETEDQETEDRREELPALLPCPFCGQAAKCEALDDPEEAQFVATCVEYKICLANPMAFGDTPAQAAAAWNTRKNGGAA